MRIREMKPIVVSIDCLDNIKGLTTGTDTIEIDYIYDFRRPWLRVDTGAIHGVWNGGFEIVFLNWAVSFQFFHCKELTKTTFGSSISDEPQCLRQYDWRSSWKSER